MGGLERLEGWGKEKESVCGCGWECGDEGREGVVKCFRQGRGNTNWTNRWLGVQGEMIDRERGTRDSMHFQTCRTEKITCSANELANCVSFFLGIVITDPNDSRFDLEAYLTMKMADEAK